MRLAYRTTMPFENDGALSPLTEKSTPFSGIERDYERRMNLPSGNHKLIEDDVDGKSYVTTPIFEGEINWNRTNTSGSKILGYRVVLSDPTDPKKPSMVFQNKDINSVITYINKKNIRYKSIEPIKASSFSNKTASKDSSFLSLVSGVLSSCFKVEAESYKRKSKEIGSCFYVKENYMITCAHVISRHSDTDFKNIGVYVIDNDKKYHARVIDIDYSLDIALIYCDSVRHSVIPYKSLDGIQVGSDVVCVGSPYGYDNNVTKGILSSKDRKIDDKGNPYFFMDLAVYPGSSGGPIVDASDGYVFGIAAVIVESIGNYGLNAGIPIDICVKRFSNVLKEVKHEDLQD